MKRNNRLKTITKIISALMIAVAVSVACAGCACNPYEVEKWYLSIYVEDDAPSPIYAVSTYVDFYANTFPDDATLEFFKDGTFRFHNFGVESEGTYTYKRKFSESKVKLTFSDGQLVEGSLNHYWGGYSADFKMNGAYYGFSDAGEGYTRAEAKERVVNHMKAIMSINGERTFSSYRTFYSGHVELKDGNYVFVYDDDKYEPAELSDLENVHTSSIDEEFLPKRVDLQEGTAILYRAIYTKTEQNKTYPAYWIWYYEKSDENETDF